MRESNSASPEEAMDELERVLRSPTFDATDRNKRFLSFVVHEALAGRADRIKAYSIGTSVFGRGDDFDPLLDPIVRIEAGRLRRSLEHHYLTADAGTRCQITIPKGTYVPVFCAPLPAASVSNKISFDVDTPRIAVKAFQHQCRASGWPDMGQALTMQVICALTRFTELFVCDHTTTTSAHASDKDREVRIDYELSGNVTITRTAIFADFLLQDAIEGRFIWSHSVERPIDPATEPAEITHICSGIAAEVASIIGQRDGIMDGEARNKQGQVPTRFSASQKLVEFQDYWNKVDLKQNETLRRDFEKVIATDLGSASAHACLSLLYTDAYRYGIDCGPHLARPIERGLELARRAVELAPRSGRAHHAFGLAKWFSGQTEPALQHLKLACTLNPNDDEFRAEFGIRSAMRMQWDVAVPMLLSVYEHNLLQSGQYRMGLFFYFFASGEYEQAYTQALLADAPAVAYPQIACAAALSRLERSAEASQHLEKAETISPGLLSHLGDDLRNRQIHPDLVDMVVGSFDRVLSKAL